MNWLLRLLLALLALALVVAPAHAHEVRPAYLEVRETAPDAYAISWKQPVNGDKRLALRPRLPETCRAEGASTMESAPAAVIERWRVTCPGGLKGQSLRIDGLERTLTSVYVQVIWRDGKSTSALAQPSSPEVSLGGGAGPALARYVVLGVEHILGGLDHLAFVAGLVLLVTGVRRLLLSLTAFTVAHSITLGLSALGGAGLSSKPVEACIALSIVLVGLETVRFARGHTGLTASAPWFAAFGFGLLHGFGFAGALSEIGLPENARVVALLLFNLGVEIGQVAVVALLLAPLLWLRTDTVALRRARVAGGYVLGGAGAFWLIQRLAAAVFAI
ncbi:MAG: HupE/UreJ family protein [Hyphomonadaceae bacterium]|nr:HupE/UreJ family protein [Hyphomonadaceae bacterium]